SRSREAGLAVDAISQGCQDSLTAPLRPLSAERLPPLLRARGPKLMHTNPGTLDVLPATVVHTAAGPPRLGDRREWVPRSPADGADSRGLVVVAAASRAMLIALPGLVPRVLP